MDYSDQIRTWITENLDARNLTQRDLAKVLGTNESTVSRMVSGDRGIDIVELASIERFFNSRAPSVLVGQMSNPQVTQLGQQTPLPESPETAVLERVPNPHPDTLYVARFTQPEFTSLCPVTGQPDFAHLVIDYVPRDYLVESKSLKLYLGAFRNHGAFHEDCTVAIGKRVADLLNPHFLRIGGYWYPRGGMPIDVFWQFGQLPDGVWLPDQGVAPYRGRG
jgi:7-cyano-7-deazaguanine reductase